MEPLAASNQPLSLVAETRPNVFPETLTPIADQGYRAVEESEHVKGCAKCQKRLNLFRALKAPYSVYDMEVKHANKVHEQGLHHPGEEPPPLDIGSNGKNYITSTAPNGDTHILEVPPAEDANLALEVDDDGSSLPPPLMFPKSQTPSTNKGKEAQYYQWLEDLKKGLYGLGDQYT